jgi:uncharacterized protein with GYD domain
MSNFTYSSGSWARMANSPGDRRGAIRRVLEALGGSLESLYWVLGTDYDGVIIVNLPDSVTAEAWENVVNKTGAVKQMDTHELLTEQQFREALVLVRDVGPVYEVPGQRD